MYRKRDYYTNAIRTGDIKLFQISYDYFYTREVVYDMRRFGCNFPYSIDDERRILDLNFPLLF